MNEYVYFIEHRETKKWWYPTSNPQEVFGVPYADYQKEFFEKLNPVYRKVNISSPNPRPIQPIYTYKFNNELTDNPNHHAIAYPSVAAAESVMKIFGLSHKVFEVTEHAFCDLEFMGDQALYFKSIIKCFEIVSDLDGIHGTIDCPACGNVLAWTRSAVNNHVWGICKTKNCLKWQQ